MAAAGISRTIGLVVALTILAALGLYQVLQLSSVRGRLESLDRVDQISDTWSGIQASTNDAVARLLVQIQTLQAKLPIERFLEADRVSESLVLFDFGTEAVSPGGIDSIAEFVERERGRHGGIRIDGFADTIGGEEYNHRLSLRRAKAVESELVRRGIDPARIVDVSGTGEATPPVRTGDEVREPSNRAVVIHVERGDPKSM